MKSCLGEGEIPEAFYYGVLVIIPKDDKGGVRGIGLLETIHKLVSQIINIRLAEAVEFVDEVHGFRKKRGTFTAIGERKIGMQQAICDSKPLYQIYLDLKKAYDSVDRERILKLLEKYKVGPNVRRYIARIWQDQKYFLRQGGFYSDGVIVERGCTQGDIDSPVIFNIIVDAVLRQWHDYGMENTSRSCFYADDGLLENNNPEELQGDLDKIVKLFAQFGLKANETKTKYMIVRGSRAPTALTTQQYDSRMQRLGTTRRTRIASDNNYNTWRKQRVQCLICGKTMQIASLNRHMKTQHVGTAQQIQYKCREVDNTFDGKMFQIQEFKSGMQCPVPGCSGRGADKFSMYRHFTLKHPRSDIIIEEDGELSKCQLCGMRTADIQKHTNNYTCKQAQRRRSNEEKQDDQFRANRVTFNINGKEIERVRQFKYLGRIFTDNDCDSVCINENLKKARQRWNCVAKILKDEGANPKCMAQFYLTIVQSVLLYGADSWCITKSDMNKLNSFHLRAVRYLSGRHIRKKTDGEWEYPNHTELLKQCGLLELEIYIQRRRGTLYKYLMENKADLLNSAKSQKRHCKNVNKIMWWNQKWIKRSEMKRISHNWFVT